MKVAYPEHDGFTHEFSGMVKVVEKARQAEDLACADLKKAFSNLH